MEAENKVVPKPAFEFIKEDEMRPDPVKDCPKCKGVMHWCSPNRRSGRTDAGTPYKGCFARNPRSGHPMEGDAFICQFCDVIYPES